MGYRGIFHSFAFASAFEAQPRRQSVRCAPRDPCCRAALPSGDSLRLCRPFRLWTFSAIRLPRSCAQASAASTLAAIRRDCLPSAVHVPRIAPHCRRCLPCCAVLPSGKAVGCPVRCAALWTLRRPRVVAGVTPAGDMRGDRRNRALSACRAFSLSTSGDSPACCA